MLLLVYVPHYVDFSLTPIQPEVTCEVYFWNETNTLRLIVRKNKVYRHPRLSVKVLRLRDPNITQPNSCWQLNRNVQTTVSPTT